MNTEEQRKAEAAMPNGYYRLAFTDTFQYGDLCWDPFRCYFYAIPANFVDESVSAFFAIRPIEGYDCDSYTHAAGLPEDAAARKAIPLHSGVFAYFPDALVEIAKLSAKGNDQHHPDKPLHWDRNKSTDHQDALLRHHVDDIKALDRQGRMAAKAAKAWRALADLQDYIDGLGQYMEDKQ